MKSYHRNKHYILYPFQLSPEKRSIPRDREARLVEMACCQRLMEKIKTLSDIGSIANRIIPRLQQLFISAHTQWRKL